VKKLLGIFALCALGWTQAASPYNGYAEDNPFVEAMLRMMEIFGLIDRDRLPLGVPYLPSYGQSSFPALGGPGGFGGLPGYPGIGGPSGLSPLYGMGGVPGLSPLYGTGAVPGMGQMPGGLGWPGGGYPQLGGLPNHWGGQNWGGPGQHSASRGLLDGIWELNKGGFVIIRGNAARLYLSKETYQDFVIGYDHQYLWWQPQAGGSTSRYRYQVRDGRMIMQDSDGNYLLLRRRR
jgi:hypothetical protein